MKETTTNAVCTNGREKNRFVKGMGFMKYGLAAFAGLVCEAVLTYGIEAHIYGCDFAEYTTPQKILHWVITCIIWGLFALFISRSANKKGYELFPKFTKNVRMWQWLCIGIGFAACFATKWIDWNGIKCVIEFQKYGALKFVFQYIYYMFEALMLMLIIVSAQKACEVWFKNENIPYGGIVAALTWGLGHWASKQSLFIGILSAIYGLALGSIYLLTNRKPKLSYALLSFMFMF